MEPTPSLSAASPPACPDSVDSSPRSRCTDSCDAEIPPIPPRRLRFMCSYGGHIVPRPHDKALCYVGGDTRIVVIDRNTSLSDLQHRLSKTLLQDQSFLLKYQLPDEDLDALISVILDEDLEIMVEEYDRLDNAVVDGGLKQGRLRLFLFPKSSSSIEKVLVEAASNKSSEWFFDALNGKVTSFSVTASDRELSESSSVNCLLGLDDDFVGKMASVGKDVEAPTDLGSKTSGNGIYATNHEMHSVPDSPLPETASSFGSSSGSLTSSYSPPLKVKVEENPKAGGVGIEEQIQQISVGAGSNVNFPPLKVEVEENTKAEGVVIEEQIQQISVGAGNNVNFPPKMQKQEDFGSSTAVGTVVSGTQVAVGSEYGNRPFSDHKGSDHDGYEETQQIQQLVRSQPNAQFQHKQAATYDFPSHDSVSSEGSVAKALSRQRQAIYQEPVMAVQAGNYGAMAISHPVDVKAEDQSVRVIQMHPQVQDSGYVLTNQFNRNHIQMHQAQQFVRMGTQYVPVEAMTYASYYNMFPGQQQYHPHQPELDPQYPVYFMPARPAQGYSLPLQQTSYGGLVPTASTIKTQASAAVINSHAPYNQVRNAPATKSEIDSSAFIPAAAAPPQLIQDPSNQHQAQYVGFTQIHHPSQSMPQAAAANSTYTYEFSDPARSQMFYAQALPSQLPAQYQTLASAPTVMLPESSPQLEIIKH